jgi:hypothetical protein
VDALPKTQENASPFGGRRSGWHGRGRHPRSPIWGGVSPTGEPAPHEFLNGQHYYYAGIVPCVGRKAGDRAKVTEAPIRWLHKPVPGGHIRQRQAH